MSITEPQNRILVTLSTQFTAGKLAKKSTGHNYLDGHVSTHILKIPPGHDHFLGTIILKCGVYIP